MKNRPVRAYNSSVNRGLWRGAMGSLLAFAFAFLGTARAQAEVTTIPTSGNPVVWVQLHAGNVVVHTWDRTDVSIDADATATPSHFSGPQVMKRIPQQVQLWSHTLHLPDGDFSLPAETFVIPPPASPVNDAVMVRGDGNVTLTVPAGTSLVAANVGRGTVQIENYRNGVIISHVGGGAVRLSGVSGTGAIQIINGPLVAVDSNFTRIRARSARGNIVFERCTVQQIEATSIVGSVIYDDGTFEPGLARFESQRGDVALGVASGAVQFNARSQNGDVQSGFGNEARIVRSGSETQAAVGSGGPIVTATSAAGSVLLYKGALRDSKLRTHNATARTILQRWDHRRPPMGRAMRPPHP